MKTVSYIRSNLAASAVTALAIVAAFTVAALFARADVGPAITVSTYNASNALVSAAPIGSSLYATALVASSTGTTTPTGSVDFNLYPNTSCSGTPSTQAGVALVGGFATSSAATMPTTGLSYKVHYNGNGSYATSDSACQAVAATSASVGVATALSTTTALVGAQAHDSATLSGETANAGGTVTYTVYTNSACTQGAQSAGAKAVSNGTVPDSDTLTFTSAGTYYWQAVYSGDAQNSAATSTCSSEVLTVNSAPAQTGRIVVDEVTVPSNATSTFHFATTGTGYANFDLTDAAAANSQTLTPGTYSITQSPLAGWVLTSATCSTNGGTTSTYAPGSSLTLNAGDVISCTFIDTSIASSSQHQGDNDGDDNGKGSDRGFPFNIHINFPHGIPMIHVDHGLHLGQIKHQGEHGKGDTDNDND